MDIIKNKLLKNPRKNQRLLGGAERKLIATETHSMLENHKPNSLISWKAPEFEFYEKTTLWYIIMSIAGIAFLGFAIFNKNYIMAITFVMAFTVIFLFANKKPRILRFSITPRGVKIQNRIYNFDHLESFWIFYDPPEVKILSLKSNKALMPHIHIHLGNANPLEIRKILLEYIEEKEQTESFIDAMARRIGF